MKPIKSIKKKTTKTRSSLVCIPVVCKINGRYRYSKAILAAQKILAKTKNQKSKYRNVKIFTQK